jgi:hypothetical protein
MPLTPTYSDNLKPVVLAMRLRSGYSFFINTTTKNVNLKDPARKENYPQSPSYTPPPNRLPLTKKNLRALEKAVMPEKSMPQTTTRSTKQTGTTRTSTTDKAFGVALKRKNIEFGYDVKPPKDYRHQHVMVEKDRHSHMPVLEDYLTYSRRVYNAPSEATI